jgi:uncharacterized protein (UPF0335 family)
MSKVEEDLSVSEIVKAIWDLDNQKSDISYEIKSYKKKVKKKGISAKQLNEALRLMKNTEEERNQLLSGANKIITEISGRGLKVDLQCEEWEE